MGIAGLVDVEDRLLGQRLLEFVTHRRQRVGGVLEPVLHRAQAQAHVEDLVEHLLNHAPREFRHTREIGHEGLEAFARARQDPARHGDAGLVSTGARELEKHVLDHGGLDRGDIPDLASLHHLARRVPLKGLPAMVAGGGFVFDGL